MLTPVAHPGILLFPKPEGLGNTGLKQGRGKAGEDSVGSGSAEGLSGF